MEYDIFAFRPPRVKKKRTGEPRRVGRNRPLAVERFLGPARSLNINESIMTDFHDVWQIGMREKYVAYSKVPNGSSTRANHIVIRVLPHGAPKGDIAAAGFYT